MTKRIIHLHLAKDGLPQDSSISFLGEMFHVHSVPTGGDVDLIVRLIQEADDDPSVDAVALDGMPFELTLGRERMRHAEADRLADAVRSTPLVDGAGVRGAFERWAIQLVQLTEPGILSRKRVLFAPSINHNGLVDGLSKYADHRRWAEPVLYYDLPSATTSEAAFRHISSRILNVAHDKPYRRVFPQAGTPGRRRAQAPFNWAQIIAGDVPAIRRYAPDAVGSLSGKIVIGECANDEDVEDLRQRGVDSLITTMPSIDEDGLDSSKPARWPASVLEACMAAVLDERELREGDYLNLMAELEWQPAIVSLQNEARINRFAFVIHPLTARYIYAHKNLQFLRWFPERWVEWVAAYAPPMRVSHMTGIRSASTGQVVEGDLYTLGSTPRQMMNRDPIFTYRRLEKIARDAEERGARIVGLGAFTSVVGDAGATVARNSDIPITSGNSLTVAATLETAKQAVRKLGASDLTQGRAMVIGATGSIGAVCSRLLAQALGGVTLVAPRPERLIALKRQIEAETPGARVVIATTPDDYVHEMDVIVTTTTAIGQRIIDVTRCKPGAVICDVARPPDIEEWEAELRPDVLVIESGEILLPGDPDIGYDVGLPPKTAYACMAETALLAMEGRFEDYSIGRDLELEKVKEIYRLFTKHGLRLAGMRSFDKFVSDEDLARRRRLADELRANPERLRRVKEAARREMAERDRRLAKEQDRKEGLGKGWRIMVMLALSVVPLSLILKRAKRVQES